MVALDLDGTLLDPSGKVPARTRAAIQALKGAGVRVVLATGRSPWSVAPIAAELDLPGPHVLMQGGLVADPIRGTTSWAERMGRDLVLEQLAFAREEHLMPILGFADGYRARPLTPEVLRLSWPTYGEGSHLTIVESLEAVAGDGAIRTFVYTSPEFHAGAIAAASARFGSRAALTWGDEYGIELLAPVVSKGAALARLAADDGLAMTQVAAVGDGRNDLEMLSMAGRSAAMATAPAEVLAAATMVVPSNADDGLFTALATWFPWLPASVQAAA